MAIRESTHPHDLSERANRTIKTRGSLSCITIAKTTRGQFVTAEYFDVPAEEYGDGNMTGYRIAAEFMAAINAASPGFDPLSVIVDACKALGGDDWSLATAPRECRRGAAVGFLRSLQGVLQMAAQAGIHEHYIEQIIARGVEWRRKQAQAATDAKMDFVRRMKMAKAAKSLARPLTTT